MAQSSAQQDQVKSYKATLNLPKTAFPMKANLVQNEPASLKRWQQQGLYAAIRAARQGCPKYTFHDGPPYANGSIHLGHLLNKVLKDIVVRSKTMAGYDCPYIPGWDCHGLPIEHKVMQELGDAARGMEPFKVRRKCKAYAEKYVKLQSKQMQRLLTLADYDDPYLTMNPGYEAAVLEVFADLVDKGLVYRALKPVHWSIANQTALADAELEYDDREDTSVYVLFEVENTSKLPAQFTSRIPQGEPVHLMIWTTTPWTLPANMAVAVSRNAMYGLYQFTHQGKSCCAILACALEEKVLSGKGGLANFEQIGVTSGEVLADPFNLPVVTYRHPFIDRICPVVTAEYVTLEDGTGLVHTAPGHGQEDYQTGQLYRLHFKGSRSRDFVEAVPFRKGRVVQNGQGFDPSTLTPKPPADIYCPVRADGTFDDTVPDWLRGVDVWQANELVVKHLHDSGHLFHQETIRHSYPHDWRSKTPVIFRATDQWFVSVGMPIDGGDCLRDRALNVTKQDVAFFPDWGRNRMRGMLESRPDWCISRQRAWGLPIPAFLPPEGVEGEPLLTAASVRAVAANIAKHGSDYWFSASPEDLLAGYDPASDPDVPGWFYTKGLEPDYALLRKSHDIFDVWFESGSSWNAVLRRRGLGYPADLYLEGSDQHRGWFQLSLLPSLGVTGQSPFKNVLTHGFMVDRDGKKMSKSGGNALEVDALLKDFGADVCRWWVGSLNADNDIKVDHEFFRIAGEEYRKVRNTIRYLLSNLNDFDAAQDRYTFTDADATSLDAWALGRLAALVGDVRQGYERFAFRKVHEAVFRFCNETMSAVYLTATKDRLYCDKPDSPRRRRTQTAVFDITDALLRLIAPILPHTADEAWSALHGDGAGSVHLEMFPEPVAVAVDGGWDRVMVWRDVALKAIEDARAGRGIDNPLDCGLRVALDDDTSDVLKRFDPVDLADLCSVSRVELADGAGGDTSSTAALEVLDLRDQPRCERCWKRDGTVRARSDGGLLSDRDAAVLGLT